jgi:hypothetical protein
LSHEANRKVHYIFFFLINLAPRQPCHSCKPPLDERPGAVFYFCSEGQSQEDHASSLPQGFHGCRLGIHLGTLRRFPRRAQAVRAVPGGGCLDRLRAFSAAPGTAVAFALDGGFRADLLAGSQSLSCHRNPYRHCTRTAVALGGGPVLRNRSPREYISCWVNSRGRHNEKSMGLSRRFEE